MSLDRTTLVVGLVFGIPPAVGVWLATLRVTGGDRPMLAVVAGGIVGLTLFLSIVVLARGGSVEPPETN